jgi:hypothetical protein
VANVPQSFQPYIVINKTPPKPAKVTHRHRKLHLVQHASSYYLADDDNHYYPVGRDAQGDLYPAYQDSSTHSLLPLYYDPDRDRYFRTASDEDGHYYRNYVGDPGDRYYPDENDNYDSNPQDYQPEVVTPPHHDRNRDAWLLAIPVVVAAYFLLQPHHHHSNQPQITQNVIVRQAPVYIIRQIAPSAHPGQAFFQRPNARALPGRPSVLPTGGNASTFAHAMRQPALHPAVGVPSVPAMGAHPTAHAAVGHPIRPITAHTVPAKPMTHAVATHPTSAVHVAAHPTIASSHPAVHGAAHPTTVVSSAHHPAGTHAAMHPTTSHVTTSTAAHPTVHKTVTPTVHPVTAVHPTARPITHPTTLQHRAPAPVVQKPHTTITSHAPKTIPVKPVTHPASSTAHTSSTTPAHSVKPGQKPPVKNPKEHNGNSQ